MIKSLIAMLLMLGSIELASAQSQSHAAPPKATNCSNFDNTGRGPQESGMEGGGG